MFFVLFSLWIQHTFEQLIYLVGHKLDFLLFIRINTKFKKKRRSCAGQHLSWCRTERLCSFPTGLELISSDSKGHHDQNKFKKNLQNSKFEPMTFSVLFICTQTKSWLQISCESFWLHSVPHQARALWVKKKRVLTCKHC